MIKKMFLHLSACLVLGIASVPAEPAAPDFVLRDFIGRDWQNERVSFPINAATLNHVKAGHALVGSDGSEVPYQLGAETEGQPSKILFLTDLPRFETRSFRFTDNRSTTSGDLKVEETADAIMLSNSITGIRLSTSLADGAGPIGAVKLPSGKWVGGSRIQSDAAVNGYSVEVLSRGPVSAEAVCKAKFADGSSWQCRLRIDANEPVVLVDETSAVEGGGTKILTLDLGRQFDPDTLLCRAGKDHIGRNITWKITEGEVYVLEAWLHWWERERQGNTCSFYREDGTDLLTLAALEAGVWVDPTIEPSKRAPTRLLIKKSKSELNVDLPLKTGQRKWMLGALDKDASLAEAKDEKKAFISPLPYRTVVKHGHFPLDMVKDYVLTWDRKGATYPHMLVTADDVKKFRDSIKDVSQYEKTIPGMLSNPNPLNQFTSGQPIKAYFATGNIELGRYLAKSILDMMQGSVDRLVHQDGIPLGAAPHHLSGTGAAMQAADAALAAGQFTPAEEERLLAQVAFLGYTMNRPEFWSPERGYSANPNMTTSVYGYQAAIACLISKHPLSKQWVKKSMEELKGQLNNWSDDNGGWLEAPHYAMVSYDQILSPFLMAYNAGFNDYLLDPKIKTVMNWFGKISTPPDSRLGGFRHLPPTGNTYLQEACGEFGLVAFLFKERDPEFASHMQWMFRQHRSWPSPGVGGAYPAFAGYRELMNDSAVPEKAPVWKSELFPKTGVVMRGGFPSDREMYLHLIQGTNHAHYDDDSGSVILWGKGRILADDFGYYNPSRSDHNMVEAPGVNGLMHVKDFSAGEHLDYVRGVQGKWTRQIVLVKDSDSAGPNYFVFCDSFDSPLPAIWRMHLIAESVKSGEQRASVIGKEDVDTDIQFLRPGALTLKTETKDRKANSGIFPDGRSGAVPMTQIALTATSSRPYSHLTALVYPRLKEEQQPAVTSLVDGKGLKIKHGEGIDYVFLSPEVFTFNEGDVSFNGQSGTIQVRNGKPTLSLGAPGSISYKGEKLNSPE
ncbi:MAG: hypothetical protein O3B01_14710 [Planctomycetota bacterium]|nr:hypothetical protein [Planctomycetota bacterium]MDA1139824.1 hypothetical protein [Planctomycetota bacterium]